MGERFNYLTLMQQAALRMACEPFDKAFPNAYGVYHVGSSLARPDYRDVDVRLILPDAEFEHLFGKEPKSTGHVDFWCLTCLAYSEWIQHRTGLPVDFQITSLSEANTAEHKGKPRNPLMLSYESERRATELANHTKAAG